MLIVFQSQEEYQMARMAAKYEANTIIVRTKKGYQVVKSRCGTAIELEDELLKYNLSREVLDIMLSH